MTISRELAECLRLGREAYNDRVAEARHRFPALNTEKFGHFVAHCLDPVAVVLAPERRNYFVTAAYDIGLELVGRDLYGAHSRGQLLETFWQKTLPALANNLPAQPGALISALINALLNLHAQNARAEQWLQLLAQYGAQVAPEQLCDVGVLVAWRAGAVQFRSSALRIAMEVPHLARPLLNLAKSQSLEAAVSLLTRDPWLLAPAHVGAAQRNVGAFSGFGGSFSQPPLVRATEDGFIVESGDRYFLLLADCFGEVLLPAQAADFAAADALQFTEEQAPVLREGHLHCPRGQVEVDRCPDGLQLVWNNHSAALFSPYSFSISVVPWR